MKTGWIVVTFAAACSSSSAAPEKAAPVPEKAAPAPAKAATPTVTMVPKDGGTSLCALHDWSDCKARCDQGNALSCSRYASMLYRGESDSDVRLEVDRAAARAAWKRSCDLGYADGCASAGLLVGGDFEQAFDHEPEHAGDFGGPIDKAAAKAMYTRACAGGVGMACRMIGDIDHACGLGDIEACADRSDKHGDDLHAQVADIQLARTGAPFKTARAAARVTCADGTTAAEITRGTMGVGGPETFCVDGDGKKQGPYLEWLSAEDLAQGAFGGRITEQGSYRDDKETGAWKRYHAEGRGDVPFEEGGYVDGEKDGAWLEGREDGYRWEGLYSHGKKTGRWTRYENDRVDESVTFADGQKDGDDVESREDGSKCIEHYTAGEVQWQRCWSANGTKTMDSPYVNGHSEGIERSWYDNGKLRETGLWKAGQRSGTWTAYYPSGRKMRETTYDANGDEDDAATKEFDDK